MKNTYFVVSILIALGVSITANIYQYDTQRRVAKEIGYRLPWVTHTFEAVVLLNEARASIYRHIVSSEKEKEMKFTQEKLSMIKIFLSDNTSQMKHLSNIDLALSKEEIDYSVAIGLLDNMINSEIGLFYPRLETVKEISSSIITHPSNGMQKAITIESMPKKKD